MSARRRSLGLLASTGGPTTMALPESAEELVRLAGHGGEQRGESLVLERRRPGQRNRTTGRFPDWIRRLSRRIRSLKYCLFPYSHLPHLPAGASGSGLLIMTAAAATAAAGLIAFNVATSPPDSRSPEP